MYHKNRIKDEHKKRHISENKDQNQKHTTPMNGQLTHNALATQKKLSLCISKLSKMKKHSVAKIKS